MHLWNKVALCASAAVLLGALAHQVSLSPRRSPLVNEMRSTCLTDVETLNEKIANYSGWLDASTSKHIEGLMAEFPNQPKVRASMAENLARAHRTELAFAEAIPPMEAKRSVFIDSRCEPSTAQVDAKLGPQRAEWAENLSYRMFYVAILLIIFYALGWALIWLAKGRGESASGAAARMP